MTPIIRRALVTSTAVTLWAVVSAAVPAAALAQEAPADTPVGLGGRVEVVTAGYALTWPESWLYIRPTQADLDAVRDGVDALAPELVPAVEAALAGGLGVSLIAFGDQSDGLPESCNVLDRAADGRSVETIAQEDLEARRTRRHHRQWTRCRLHRASRRPCRSSGRWSGAA